MRVTSVCVSSSIPWYKNFEPSARLQAEPLSPCAEIDAINVKTKNDQIVVSAKSTFDLRKLLFLGSNKAGDDETIGQFGEGAKAAYVSMIKMGVHDPINVSGD